MGSTIEGSSFSGLLTRVDARKVSARFRNLHLIRKSCDWLGRCGFAKPQQQMILLLGYFVSLTATFVMSVALLSVVLAATRANEATLYHLHRSDTVQLSKHGNKELLGKSRLVTAEGPSKTKASLSVVER
jgi:hypothetical protein